MKKIFTLFAFLLLVGTAQGQAPQGIPYQAAARNSSGEVLASTAISVRFTIRGFYAMGEINYQETHSAYTDVNGIFSLTVGLGTPVVGSFESISWGSDTKYLQVELDPTGGSTYIDMGTQQMMSVPYSLFSKAIAPKVSATGDTVFFGGGNFIIFPGVSAVNCSVSAGTITGASTVCTAATTTLASTVTGGTWSSANTSIATINSAGALTGISNGTTLIRYIVSESCGNDTSYKLVTVLPITAGTITGNTDVNLGGTSLLSNTILGGVWSSSSAEIATVGSSGMVTGVAAGTTTISYTITNACGTFQVSKIVTVNALYPGVSYGGGKIFYILQSGDLGYVPGQRKGLVAATTDQGSFYWSDGFTNVSTSSGLGTGAANTNNIVATYGGGTYAARVCSFLSLGGYDDWYLPSLNELSIMSSVNSLIGGFGGWSSSVYWSSTQHSSISQAYSVNIFNGTIAWGFKISSSNRVRAIRTFSCPETAGTITGINTICVGNTTTLSNSVTSGTWSSSATGIATVNSSGIVSGISAGTATISYTVTETCGSVTTTLVVTVNPLASTDIITGSSSVCVGSSTILANAATGGIWTSSATGIATIGGTGVVVGVAAGTATISYTTTNSCGSTVATRIVTVNALPNAGTITGIAEVFVGHTTILSNTIAGGIWRSSDTAKAIVSSTGTVTGIASGVAIISYEDINSCGSAIATRVVTVSPAAAIGGSYGGGKIAYIFQSGDPGYVVGETHGLIAATSDQIAGTGIMWFNGFVFSTTGASDTALGTGLSNTNTIVAAQGEGDYAAKLCADLVLGGYSDWFLPSFAELRKLYINRSSIGGFSSENYWSSSEINYADFPEYDGYFAKPIDFNDGFAAEGVTKESNFYVRAVRYF